MVIDPLHSYFEELKTIKPANQKEYEDLWKKAKKGDKKAFNRLIELNYCLVIPIAKRFSKKGVDFMDLISDGNMGLVRAVEKFDTKKNTKFSTYATYWIEQFIRKSIEDNSKTIRIPSYMFDIINKWKKIRNQLLGNLGREPSIKEIAHKMKISIDQANEINKTIFSVDNIDSLDSTINEDSESSKKDTLKDTILKTPEAITEIIRNSNNVQKALDFLPEREAEIIKLRFGLGGIAHCSLDEVGKKFKLSRERVRQIELKAFQRLKGIFIKLKLAEKSDVDKLILDQRESRFADIQKDRRI
ncbi:MAG: RNA polymerase sigma factor RpoD/SigA [Endomicrobiaceae bacterium]|jgi:RNA polymerase primary sigma factor|nr:RNA polymerase sigma factor RpoD/SigA [Endomicrobiaceae bacterium]MDD3729979.1 RNA polymerase sigma factor RpoD/SigA [Endomicrobiaceae bacterium]